MLASLKDAREYFVDLPRQLESYLDADYQQALANTLEAINQLLDVVSTVDQQARDDKLITTAEATVIGEHGFVLLLKLIDLMEKLDLPHKRQEIEQISLVFARWVMHYNGRLNHIEPLVNAFAQSANSMTEKKSLLVLVELMSMVIDSSADSIKHDVEDSSLYRPWRLLHLNRGIVATRTHDVDLMKRVFDEMIFYLPQDAAGFFSEGVQEMEALDYPPPVRKLIEQYHLNQAKARLH
jgi:hypothetical protein